MDFYLHVITFIIVLIVINFLTRKKIDNTLFAFAFLVLWLCAGSSEGYGVDYDVYDDIFYFGGDGLETLWPTLNLWLLSLGFSSRAFFMLTSLVILFCYARGIKRYSSNVWLSLLLLVICYFYYESMNVIRQSTAMALIFLLTPWSWRSRINCITYIALMIVTGLTIHKSTFIMIPIYIISLVKIQRRYLVGAIITSLIIGSKLIKPILTYCSELISTLNYDEHIYKELSTMGSGLRFYFFSILGIFMILSIKRNDDTDNYRYVNLVTAAITLQNIFILSQPMSRLSWFTMPFIIITTPLALSNINIKFRYIIGSLIVLGLFLLYYKSTINTDFGTYSFFHFNIFR